jgi:hypothetical protein
MSDSFKDLRCMLQDRTSLSLGLQRRCYAVLVEVGESVDDVETSLPNRGVTLPIQSEHNGYQAMSRDGSSCPDVSQFGSCERYRLLAGLKGGARQAEVRMLKRVDKVVEVLAECRAALECADEGVDFVGRNVLEVTHRSCCPLADYGILAFEKYG